MLTQLAVQEHTLFGILASQVIPVLQVQLEPQVQPDLLAQTAL